MKQTLTTVTNHLRQTSHTQELLTWINLFRTRALLSRVNVSHEHLLVHAQRRDSLQKRRGDDARHAANIIPLNTCIHIFRSQGDIQINHIRKVRQHNESLRRENNWAFATICCVLYFKKFWTFCMNEIRIMILELAYVVLGRVLYFRCSDVESHVQSIAITAISTRINASVYMYVSSLHETRNINIDFWSQIFQALCILHCAFNIRNEFGTSLVLTKINSWDAEKMWRWHLCKFKGLVLVSCDCTVLHRWELKRTSRRGDSRNEPRELTLIFMKMPGRYYV